MELITRQDAKAKGLKRYFTGEPCKYGHLDERVVSDKNCVTCNREKSRRHAGASEKWRQENAERDKLNKRKYYLNHKDEIQAQSEQWRKDNPDRQREHEKGGAAIPKSGFIPDTLPGMPPIEQEYICIGEQP